MLVLSDINQHIIQIKSSGTPGMRNHVFWNSVGRFYNEVAFWGF
jgi:hypothetical protein